MCYDALCFPLPQNCCQWQGDLCIPESQPAWISSCTSCLSEPATRDKTAHSKPSASWSSETEGKGGGSEDEETADLFPITELKQHASPIAFMYIFLAVNEMEYVVFCYHRESSSTSVSEHIISFWGFTITRFWSACTVYKEANIVVNMVYLIPLCEKENKYFFYHTEKT